MDTLRPIRGRSASFVRMKIQDPHGQTWRVTRRWVPWRRRLRGAWERMPDLPSGDDPVSMVLAVAMLILALPVLVLTFVAGLEFLLILLFLPFAVLGRVLFGQHWTVEARNGFTPVWEARAGSWRESRTMIQDVATVIQQGHLPPRTIARD